jgi:hypothetical protein
MWNWQKLPLESLYIDKQCMISKLALISVRSTLLISYGATSLPSQRGFNIFSMNTCVVWGVTPYNLVNMYRRKGGICCLRQSKRSPP